MSPAGDGGSWLATRLTTQRASQLLNQQSRPEPGERMWCMASASLLLRLEAGARRQPGPCPPTLGEAPPCPLRPRGGQSR
eukprot:scaffold38915_cov60-Phaeocystis_antarctica.AAC.1